MSEVEGQSDLEAQSDFDARPDPEATKAAKSLADRFGWRHSHDDTSLLEEWPGAPFGAGMHVGVHNIVRASVDGVDVVAFDYNFIAREDQQYIDRYNPAMRQHYLVAVATVGAPLPAMSATEGKWAHWTPSGDRVGGDHPRFFTHYEVFSDDPDFAAAVLRDEHLDRILHRMQATEWRTHSHHLVCWGHNQKVGHDLENLLAALVPLAHEMRAAAGAGSSGAG